MRAFACPVCNSFTPFERGRCLADSLILRGPAPDDTMAREKLVPTAKELVT